MAGRFQSLTPAAVKAMKPGDQLRENQIIVTKLQGDERWTVEFMCHRQRVHRVLGLGSEGWTRRQCEERIQEIRNEIMSRSSSLPPGRKTQMLIADLGDWYLAEMEATNGKNLAKKKWHVRQRLIPALGKVPAEKLNDSHVGRFVNGRLEEGAQSSTINRELATLSHMLRTAAKRGKLIRLPHGFARLKEELTPRTPLTDADIAKLRNAAQSDIDQRTCLFIEFALDTAMRQSEIGRARFCDVQWERCRLILWQAKAGRRYQPLSQRLIALLKEERDNRSETDRDGWIFPAKSKTGHVRQFNHAYRRVVIAAGLDRHAVTPHLFRHTATTRLAELGFNIPTIQEITGHQTAEMVLRYIRMGDRAVNEAMRVLEEANSADYTQVTQELDDGSAAKSA